MVLVGSRIREDRERAMLSLRELSEKSGVARDNISNIEKGTTKNPHPKTLRKLASALGVTGDHWFAKGDADE
jgi:transcriptional regulator with XRE-family HTH domain